MFINGLRGARPHPAEPDDLGRREQASRRMLLAKWPT
jgi:hypothetical protein